MAWHSAYLPLKGAGTHPIYVEPALKIGRLVLRIVSKVTETLNE